jgi:hypothetical protein
MHGGEERSIKVLFENPEVKGQLGRLRSRRHDNIKMDVQEIGQGTRTGLIWLRAGTRGCVL